MTHLTCTRITYCLRVAIFGAAALMLGACTPLSGDLPKGVVPVHVNIPFDTKGCPQQPEPVSADKAKRIVWQSVDASSNTNTPERYEIFFDPFVGRPQRSDKTGKLVSLPFDKDVPPTLGTATVEYKYTIVGDRCKDKPMDPRLWLRR